MPTPPRTASSTCSSAPGARSPAGRRTTTCRSPSSRGGELVDPHEVIRHGRLGPDLPQQRHDLAAVVRRVIGCVKQDFADRIRVLVSVTIHVGYVFV